MIRVDLIASSFQEELSKIAYIPVEVTGSKGSADFQLAFARKGYDAKKSLTPSIRFKGESGGSIFTDPQTSSASAKKQVETAANKTPESRAADKAHTQALSAAGSGSTIDKLNRNLMAAHSRLWDAKKNPLAGAVTVKSPSPAGSTGRIASPPKVPKGKQPKAESSAVPKRSWDQPGWKPLGG